MDSLVDLRMKPSALGQRCGRSGLARWLTVVVGFAARIIAVRIQIRLFKNSVVVCVVRVHVVVGMVTRLRLHCGNGVAMNRSVGITR
eukprot:5577933-Pleurochrysis_carterae.AAC.2